MTLSAILDGSSKSALILVQADASQNHLPIVRSALKKKRHAAVLFSYTTPIAYFQCEKEENITVLDWTDQIPGYTEWHDPRPALLNAVTNASEGPLTVIIEGIDTLSQDLTSTSSTYIHLASLLKTRPSIHLIISLSPSSPLLPLLTPPTFSPSFTLLTLHASALIRHLATAYLTPPPPLSPPERFWALFGPAAMRGEGERLALAAEDDFPADNGGIVEVLTRAAGGRRGVDRTLEAWISSQGNVRAGTWDSLPSLRHLNAKLPKGGDMETPDPTASLSFNLNLTDAQQRARAEVPLPYAHQDAVSQSVGRIDYEPDSADDMDDDDPDEDLDI